MLFEVRVPKTIRPRKWTVARWGVRELEEVAEGGVLLELQDGEERVELISPCYVVLKKCRIAMGESVHLGDGVAVVEA